MAILIQYTNNKEIIKRIPKDIIYNTTLVKFNLMLKEIKTTTRDIQHIKILPYII